MSARGRTATTRRWSALLVSLLTVFSVACEGGDPASSDAPLRPAEVALAISMQAAATGGGEAEAYAAVNGIEIVIMSAGSACSDGVTNQVACPILFDQTFPYDPKASETRIPISVAVDGETQATLATTLFGGDVPLFTGTAPLLLSPTEVATANLVLVPVAASISVPDTLPPLVSINETRALPGKILFATGDSAASLHLTWTSLTPQTVTVQTSGTTSSVVAVSPGIGSLIASYGAFSQNVSVRVQQVTAQVDLQPASTSLLAGDTTRLTATPLDAGGTAIPGRTATWGSSDSTVAIVDPRGLVQGMGAGTATISATIDGVAGDATVTVGAPPGVKPLAPTGVTGSDAYLQGTVNPNNDPTNGWFEWGTDPRFGSYAQTTPKSVGSSIGDVTISEFVTGLKPDNTYYYRVAASNTAGTVRSAATSFQTQPIAPSNFSASFDGDLYMNWQDNSVTETSFVVERSTTSATAGFTTSSTWGANATGGSEAPPFPAQVLYYRVKACNGFGCSPPSNVDTLIAQNPSIQGTLYLCYAPGTASCIAYVSQTVSLSGAATDSTVSDATYGTYYFYTGLTGGSTYTVSVRDVACQSAFRTNQFTVTPGWGESLTVDFYADTVLCAAPGMVARDSGPFDPVVARFLGIDDGSTGARAGPAPR